MSESELQGLTEEDLEEIESHIRSRGRPGADNQPLIETLQFSPAVVDEVVGDLADMFEIVKVHVYRDSKIGITARYRWTIERWAGTAMEEWLHINDWENIAHLRADWREKEDNEAEFRYRKEFGDFTVYLNAWVMFPNRVFEALNKGHFEGKGMVDGEMENYLLHKKEQGELGLEDG